MTQEDEERVKEIEERNQVKSFNLYPNNIDPTLMKVIYDDVGYILSLLKKCQEEKKELEQGFNNQVEMRNKLTIIKFELEARIKELEGKLEYHKSHYEATLANWNFTLERVKELEEGREYLIRLFKIIAPQCASLDNFSGLVSQFDNYIAGQNQRVKGLEDGINDCLQHPMLPFHVETILKKLMEKN